MVEIDPEDTPFPALVLHPECPLWSNDTHMKRQSLVTCYSAGEIADLKENNDRHNDVRRCRHRDHLKKNLAMKVFLEWFIAMAGLVQVRALTYYCSLLYQGFLLQ